jgi:hypothetical protein
MMPAETMIEAMERWVAGGEPVPPHAEILRRLGDHFLMYRVAWSKMFAAAEAGARWSEPANTLALFEMRFDAIKKFGFALPSGELIEALRARQPIVEIGAGSGYLTRIMRHAGIDVVGTDAPESGENYGFRRGEHDERQLALPGKTAVRRFRDRTVFCSWPSLEKTWFRQALRAMRVGQRLVAVLEDACAEETARDVLDGCFEEEKAIPVPAWPHMNDYAAAWVKKRNR